MSHTLTLPWIKSATKQFVFADRMREVLSLAIASRQFVIFNGPGGHGKSEFMMAALSGIKGISPYIKSLGQGTTTEELFGGIDFDALNRDDGACIQYKPELSFLAHPVVIFEEMFDAPGRVLNVLKDTLTARQLRNGTQVFDMRTLLMFVATNHSPADIAAAGPDVEALIQRFALQLEVKWESYESDSFLDMFLTTDGAIPETDLVSWEDIIALQGRTTEVEIGKHIKQILAKVIEELGHLHVSISPRTAMKALELIRAAAAINDRDHAIPEDIQVIGYLPGCKGQDKKITHLIEEYSLEFHPEISGADKLTAIENRLGEIDTLIDKRPIPTSWTKLHQEMVGLQRQLQELRPTPEEKGRHTQAFDLSRRLYDDLRDLKNGRLPESFKPSFNPAPAPSQPIAPTPAPVTPPTAPQSVNNGTSESELDVEAAKNRLLSHFKG